MFAGEALLEDAGSRHCAMSGVEVEVVEVGCHRWVVWVEVVMVVMDMRMMTMMMMKMIARIVGRVGLLVVNEGPFVSFNTLSFFVMF